MLWNKVVLEVRGRHIGALLLASPLTAVFGWWALNWPWESPNAPAWVQAVGSVAAILVSIWIASAGERRDEQRHRLEEAQAQAKVTLRLNMINYTALSIHDFSVRLLNRSFDLAVFKYDVDLDQVTRSLEGYFEQLNKLDVMELPDEMLGKAFLMIWGNVREAQVEIRLAANCRKSKDPGPAIDSACKRMLDATHYWCETVKTYDASTSLTSKHAEMCFEEIKKATLLRNVKYQVERCSFGDELPVSEMESLTND